ncbi:AMP-binding protein [Nocardia sp. NBC_01499]|uniref:AMP-binding protein n=1 Tax=Nocardia sp. NBC_01499 TaxID=2903597 RepID=UPI003866913F
MIMLEQAAEPAATAHAASTTLTAELVEALRRFPGSTVSDDDSTLSFAAVYAAAARRSGILRCRFVPGEAVPLRSRNSIGFVIDLLGYLLSGLRPVLMAGAAVSAARTEQILEYAAAGTDIDGSAVALYLTCDDATGVAKLIPRTHAGYLLSVWLAARNAELTTDDCYLVSVPVAQNYALGCPGILGALLSGARVVLTRATDYAGVTAAVARHGATVLPLLPAQARCWYGRGVPASPSLRLVQIDGAAVKSADVHALVRLFGVTVQYSFAMAEGLLCQSAPSDDLDHRAGRIGRTLSDRDEFRIVEPDQAGRGRLEVRGPCTITSYLAAPEVNATKFSPDGWLRTGNLASGAGGRRFVVHSRADDLINRGGCR